VAVATAPGARRSRSLLGMLVAMFQARARRKGQVSRVAALIQDHVLTVAAMAAVDVGMFHLDLVAGWCAVGVSLLIVDLKLNG
jgi:hypothetical protein